MNNERQAETTADSSTQPIETTSAHILQNTLLLAVHQ